MRHLAARRLVSLVASLLVAACGEGMIEEHSLEGDARLPPEEFAVSSLQSPVSASGATLYLNFDGVTLRYGASNSKAQTTWLIPRAKGSVSFPAFTTANYGRMDRAHAIQQLVAAVKADFKDYNLQVVTTRPTSGDYTEVVIGGRPSLIDEAGTTAGIAPLDTRNYNANDIVLVFSDALYNLTELAHCISHEAGHSYGLDHLKPLEAIMYPVLQRHAQTFMAGYTYDDNRFQDEPALLKAALGAAVAPAPAPAPSAPANASSFVSQTVPTTVAPGESFVAKLTFKNTGTATWTSSGGYAIHAADSTWGGNRVSLTGSTTSVRPGAEYTFGFYAKAPTTPGTYRFQWQMGRNGEKFGAASQALTITVKAAQTTAAQPPIGDLELATATSGRGWAYDANTPDKAVRVDVYIDGQYVGFVNADRQRTDLGPKGVRGNYHGFAFAMPAVAPGQHKIEVYAVDDADGYAYKLGPTRYFTK
ncbi:MAG: NBR1-Ig-like domain-containing protein [Myxococcales bacterium]